MTKPTRLRPPPAATTLPPAVAAERLDRIRAKLQAMDDPMGATDRAVLNMMALGSSSALTASAVDAAADHLADRFNTAFSHYREALDIALGKADTPPEERARIDREWASAVRAVIAEREPDADPDAYHAPLTDLEAEIRTVRLAAANTNALAELLWMLEQDGKSPPERIEDAVALIAETLQTAGDRMVDLQEQALKVQAELRNEIAALKARGVAA